jgi:hypothetical protein
VNADGTLGGIQVDNSRSIRNAPSLSLLLGFGWDGQINKALLNACRNKKVLSYNPPTATVPPPSVCSMNVDDDEVTLPPTNTPNAKTTNHGSKTAPILQTRDNNKLEAAVGSALRGRGTTPRKKNHRATISSSLTPRKLQLALHGEQDEEDETSPFDDFVTAMSDELQELLENGSQGTYSEGDVKLDSNSLMAMIRPKLSSMQLAFVYDARALARNAKLAEKCGMDYSEVVVHDTHTPRLGGSQGISRWPRIIAQTRN